MTRYFLTELSIEGFRGINNNDDPLIIKLRANAVNSIHAPNGIGKTSIYEAIHYAIFGNVPRLSKLQASEDPEAYYINKFHKDNKAIIGLKFSDEKNTNLIEIVVERDSIGNRTITSPSNYPEPTKFLESLREDFTLVDYQKFSEFVNSSALERGRTFSSLVGLSHYSQLRQSLETVSNTRTLNTDFNIPLLESEIKVLQKDLNENIQKTLIAYKSVSGNDETTLDNQQDLITMVSNAFSSIALLNPFFNSKTIMSIDFDSVRRAISEAEGGINRKRYDELCRATNDLDLLKATSNEIIEKDNIIKLISDRDNALLKSGTLLLRELYTAAQKVVTDPSWTDPNQCPTCDSIVDIPLNNSLAQHILKYADVDTLNNKINTQISNSNLIKRLKLLEDSRYIISDKQDRRHADTIQLAESGNLTASYFNKVFTLSEIFESKRKSEYDKLNDEKLQLEKLLPPSLVALLAQIDSAKQFRDGIEKHNKILKDLQTKNNKLSKRLKWKTFIDKAAKLFAKAESNLASERIKQIETNYQTLFANLIRGGQNVKPQLVRSEKGEHVELKLADFHNLKDINARAVLSESYRNAIAAAIFLSAAIIHKGVPRFIVLDDITSSFDAGHQFNLMEAIRTQLQQPTNPNGLQFIILSHDTMLEKYFDRLSGGTDWHHQKLQGMPPVGRVMISAQEFERLRHQVELHLSAGQTDIGSPLLRHYLEFKLSQIITKLQILVPPDYAMKGDNRTLSSYIDAIQNSVKLYEEAKRLILTPQQVIDFRTVHSPAIISNFVSHYETGTGTPFSPVVLLGVLSTIDSLVQCFQYSDNSSPPKNIWYRRLDLR